MFWSRRVAFSPDGRPLASVGHDGTARLRDPAAGQHRRTPTGRRGTVSLDARPPALAALCDQLNQAQACYPGIDLVQRYEVKSRPSPA